MSLVASATHPNCKFISNTWLTTPNCPYGSIGHVALFEDQNSKSVYAYTIKLRKDIQDQLIPLPGSSFFVPEPFIQVKEADGTQHPIGTCTLDRRATVLDQSANKWIMTLSMLNPLTPIIVFVPVETKTSTEFRKMRLPSEHVTNPNSNRFAIFYRVEKSVADTKTIKHVRAVLTVHRPLSETLPNLNFTEVQALSVPLKPENMMVRTCVGLMPLSNLTGDAQVDFVNKLHESQLKVTKTGDETTLVFDDLDASTRSASV